MTIHGTGAPFGLASTAFISNAVVATIPPSILSSALLAASADRAGMRSFFASMGLTYLPELGFINEDFRKEAATFSKKCLAATDKVSLCSAHSKDNDAREFLKAMSTGSKTLRYAMSEKIGIARINESIGLGCFALSKIEKDELIGEYTGYISEVSLLSGTNAYCMLFNPWIELVNHFTRKFLPTLVVDAEGGGNETRFINHAASGLMISDSGLSVENVELSTAFSAGLFHTLLHATRDIYEGEELRFDYGPSYWDKQMKKND
nr:SET domain-containing protein-lysine N-methyltransferase [bacterium]